MVNALLELLGLALIVAFVWLMFWPAALLVGGALLVVAANVRQGRARRAATEARR